MTDQTTLMPSTEYVELKFIEGILKGCIAIFDEKIKIRTATVSE